MNDTLAQREREVEEARSKLAIDLATLRSPATFSSFTEDLKRDALETKDALMEQAKVATQSRLTGFVEDLKAKAAANPAAALAIGAGIAWRMLRNPPIATALIGAGLYGLLRTSAYQPPDRSRPDYLEHGRQRLKEQAGEFAASAKGVAAGAGEAVSAKTAEMIEAAKIKTQELTETAQLKARELSETAQSKAQEWSDTAQSKAREWTDDMGRSATAAGAALKAQTASTASRTTDTIRSLSEKAQAGASASTDIATRAFQDTVAAGRGVLSDQDARDKLLLGVAGLAVAAALGIACQKRMTEEVD
jgi:hypothetical protein